MPQGVFVRSVSSTIGLQWSPMYDKVGLCQGKFLLQGRKGTSAWWGWGQGRRTLAFILTLDAGPTTPILALGTKLRFFSELRSIEENPSFCIDDQKCPPVERNHLRRQPSGSINHVFGPALHHDCLFKLPPPGRKTGCPIPLSAAHGNQWEARTAPHANRAP